MEHILPDTEDSEEDAPPPELAHQEEPPLLELQTTQEELLPEEDALPTSTINSLVSELEYARSLNPPETDSEAAPSPSS